MDVTIKDLGSLSIDALWELHEDVGKLLSERIVAEKAELERRLAQLTKGKTVSEAPQSQGRRAPGRQRRSYPPVAPKYRNPSAPEETWSGRGRQPRWLVAALKSGRKLEEFSIFSGT